MIDLSISHKNILSLFSELKQNKFVIPAYQRPYTWDNDKCSTLWSDIEGFFFENSVSTSSDSYFLGTIVAFTNPDDKNKEIIDGQQRLTSLLLLLRAFYSKLEGMPDDAKVKNLKSKIAPVIWSNTDRITNEITETSEPHIYSEVATDESKHVLHKILKDGQYTPDEAKSNLYAANYKFFEGKCNEFATTYPIHWFNFCITVLEDCVLLPIDCPKRETALRIFTTLNDRGEPLSDADIFKGTIYKETLQENRSDFIENWNDFSSVCENAKIQPDVIFRDYMHILRAKGNDTSNEIGLRKFYIERHPDTLKDTSIIDKLTLLAEFWLYVNSRYKNKPDSIKFDLTDESKKYLQCFSFFPNVYWRYPISIYFSKYRGDEKFSEKFTGFIKKLLASMVAKFIINPTLNQIKPEIFKLNVALQNNDSYLFSINIDDIEERFYSSSKIQRTLICLHAYLNESQDDLLPDDFHIEHILPQKWQNTNYNNWSHEEAKKHLEMYGNKVAFENKLNIQAGNGYFGQKKTKYSISKIQDIKDLCKHESNDWTKEDIDNREKSFTKRVLDFFKVELKQPIK